MEALLLVACKTGIELPEGNITPADLALLIWLNDPDQLRRANCERIVLRFQSFYCFMNRTLEAPLFEMPADVVLKRIEERTNQFNRNRQRGGGAAVWMYEFGNEVAFLIRFGGSLKRDEVMDNDQCRPDIRRPVGYDLVVYNIETGELRIREGCRTNLDTIIEWLLEEAQLRGLPHGKFTRTIAKSLVLTAIRRFERKFPDGAPEPNEDDPDADEEDR